MTVIKVQHVVSCSSEDTLHKADNLLLGDSYKKWTSGGEGEKQASVILQLEKASTIHSLDVGNESSAFVEILGGHSSTDGDDYQVILVTSSFMSPIESRNNTNANRVRMFGPETLNKAVADKKFDRIKIVCTQPFNKRIKYGLSFIKLHGPPGADDPKLGPTTALGQSTLGKFKLKEENKSSLAVGSFFKSRDKEPTESPKPLTGAAAVRAAATLAATSSSPTSSRVASPKVQKQAPVKRRLSEEDRVASPRGESVTKKPARQDSTPKRPETERPTSSSPREPPAKKHRESEKKPAPATGEAFRRMMKKVVFVLSGFQNPLRAELRQKALDMGAQYKGDWGPGCTHLICAFASTPKYNQVRGKGKIVKKDWITDCYRKRMLLPWRRYKLSSGQDSSSEDGSETDEEEEEEEERKTPVKPKPSAKESPRVKGQTTPQKTASPGGKKGKGDDKNGGSTDEEGNDTEPMADDSSGGDTEDEIRRIQSKAKDPYAGSTDEEERDSKKKDKGSTPADIPDLPDFLSSKHFMLYGQFDKEERRQVNRFIIAFNGVVENYMNEKVSYVVTNSNWDDSFDTALSDNEHLTFVKPRWLFACNEKLKMVPFQPYIVVPAN